MKLHISFKTGVLIGVLIAGIVAIVVVPSSEDSDERDDRVRKAGL